MVIQDDSEAPIEVSVMKTPQLEGKKYVIVKNHVRELPAGGHASPGHSSVTDDSSENEKSAKKKKKSPKKDKKVILEESQENIKKNEFKHTNNESQDIRRVLEEFRIELHECFSRLEAKLDNIIQAIDSPSTHTNNLSISSSEGECHCQVNTKIIFDENGQQIVTDLNASVNHVCPKKLKRKYSDVIKNTDVHNLVMAQTNTNTRNLAVEYEEQNITLPTDLVSLGKILQDSKIAISYRNQVIDKVKSIKLEHINDIRFNRPAMIEKLKSSESNAVFEFKGANLFSLPGYPDWNKLHNI